MSLRMDAVTGFPDDSAKSDERGFGEVFHLQYLAAMTTLISNMHLVKTPGTPPGTVVDGGTIVDKMVSMVATQELQGEFGASTR